MGAYLKSTGRDALATLADSHKDLLTADADVMTNPGKYFDEVYEIDLSSLEPHLVGPHTPDLARPISAIAKEAKENCARKQRCSVLT
jgi:aconitate hydratase